MISTNIEQAKRLLEAGISPDTADMTWVDMDVLGAHMLCTGNYGEYPAWSLGALWDILKNAGIKYEYDTTDASKEVIDSLVDAICRFARQGRLNI